MAWDIESWVLVILELYNKNVYSIFPVIARNAATTQSLLIEIATDYVLATSGIASLRSQ